MDYLGEEQVLLSLRNASALYQKQQYTAVVLLLQPELRHRNYKLLEILAKSYYNLQLYTEAHSLSKTVLEQSSSIDSQTRVTFLYLLTLCQHQLNLPDKDKNRAQLQKLVEINLDWGTIRKERPGVQQIKENVERLMKEEESFKYFSESELPVFLIPISWFSQLEEGKLEPVNSLHLVESNSFIDTDKFCLHYNYILKEHLMECQDYKIVGAATWRYISQNVGGTEIKRFTVKVGNAVMVQSKFRSLSVLCATATKLQLVTLPVSRLELVSQLKDRIKRLLIRFNLIDKEALLTKASRLIHIKSIHNPHLLAKLAQSSTGPVIDFPCTELNDQLTISQAEILPKQFLILQLSKLAIFHSKKQEVPVSPSNRCFVCSSQDPAILCECKTISYCSTKCKSNNVKHLDACRAIQKQKTGLTYLINAFEINKDSKIPSDLTSNKTGLQNIGNTCFLNAALQCIVGIDQLSMYFFKNNHLKDINFRNPLGSEGKLACAYGQFLKQLYFTNKRAIQPRLLKRIVQKKNSTFSGYQQQDSQEFLSYFLDLLHEDLNKVKDKPNVENIESDGRPDNVIAQITLENYQKRNKSIITDLMMGQYRSELECPDCGKISITFDPYMTVTLPLPNNRDRIDLDGYFIYRNGLIKKVQERVSNRNVDQILSNFNVKSCHALIEKKEISKIYPLDEPISSIANSKSSIFLYEVGEDTDVEFHFQVLQSHTKQLLSFTRRIFSKKIKSQKQIEDLAYDCVADPFIKGFNIKGNRAEYLQYCHEHQLLTFEQPLPDIFPIEKGVHKLKVYLKSELKSKAKFNVSVGTIDLAQPQGELTIPNLLKSFSIPEKLTEDNSWYCNVCKKHQLATKKLSLYSVPQYLILHLKRFSNKIHGRYVFNQKIDTPLRLSETEEINGRKYELFGIVNHMGTMSGGHYTSFVKKNEWVYFDDERCRRMELSGVYAYLLFYKAISK